MERNPQADLEPNIVEAPFDPRARTDDTLIGQLVEGQQAASRRRYGVHSTVGAFRAEPPARLWPGKEGGASPRGAVDHKQPTEILPAEAHPPCQDAEPLGGAQA